MYNLAKKEGEGLAPPPGSDAYDIYTFIFATKYAELVTWVFKYAYIIFVLLILQMYQKMF